MRTSGFRPRDHFRRAVGCGLLAASLALGSCHGYAPLLEPTQGTAELAAQARVVLTEVDGDILKFSVFNLTGQPLLVSRDAIAMSSSQGLRSRKPGGVANVYLVPPNGSHAVNVRFSFSGLKKGETLNILFDRALSIDGRPLALPPISLRVVELVKNAQPTRL